MHTITMVVVIVAVVHILHWRMQILIFCVTAGQLYLDHVYRGIYRVYTWAEYLLTVNWQSINNNIHEEHMPRLLQFCPKPNSSPFNSGFAKKYELMFIPLMA